MTNGMDPKRRMALEAELLEVRGRVHSSITLPAMKNAPFAQYHYVKVFRDGEDIWLALLDDKNMQVHSIKLNPVVASTMAIDVLELVQPLFPGDFDIQAKEAPPKEHQS